MWRETGSHRGTPAQDLKPIVCSNTRQFLLRVLCGISRNFNALDIVPPQELAQVSTRPKNGVVVYNAPEQVPVIVDEAQNVISVEVSQPDMNALGFWVQTTISTEVVIVDWPVVISDQNRGLSPIYQLATSPKLNACGDMSLQLMIRPPRPYLWVFPAR